MRRNDFDNFVINNTHERLCIGQERHKQYANDNDTLHNFKAVSKIAKILKPDITTPDGYALQMFIVKVTRLFNQWKEKGYGSIKDTVLDCHNYLDLAVLCKEDREENE